MALQIRMTMLIIGKNRKRGFSLLEIMVVLLLIGIFTAIAVPTFKSVTGSELKKTANQLLGLVRDTYSRASLSGKTCRIVFDIDKKEYWVEESADVVKIQTATQEEDTKKEERDTGQAATRPQFKPVEDELGEKHKLPDDIYFKSIWVDRFSSRVTQGQVFLYFFPDGYTEEAQIIISDDPKGERLFNLVVEPLTGTVMIENQELPLEK